MNFADREEWWALLREVRAEDIFFSPEYLKCNEIVYNGQAECFVYQGTEAVIVYPYILRPIEGTNYFDITSGYGYGGFIGWPRYQELDEFRWLFRDYCRERKIVSEFIRFHPFYENHLVPISEVQALSIHQEVVYSKTNVSEEELHESITREAWKKIRKSLRNNLNIIQSLDDQYYFKFIDIYYETMERLQASKFYFFPVEFFYNLKNLSNDINLFTVTYENKVVGGLLILIGDKYSYNFLSGSKADFVSLGINDYLQFKVLEWARQTGKEYHLLGGGLKRGDSLFRFKSKYSKLTINYYLGKFIWDSETYNKLVDTRRGKLTGESMAEIDWFPAYRVFFG